MSLAKWQSFTDEERRKIKILAGNPQRLLAAIDKEKAERSFHAFVKQAWHVLEPDREMSDGWAIRLLCSWVQDYALRKKRRIVMNVPPGMMKSLLLNVFLPAWVWGPKDMPGARFIGASYSPDISVRDNRKCRNLIESPWYRARWGHRVQLVGDQNAKTRFDTSATGFKIATSVAGMSLGERADYFNIDDPHNLITAESNAVRGEAVKWGTEVVPTRINDPNESGIALIMQRVHERDLSAYYIDLGYQLLCLPMEFEPDHPFRSVEDPRTVDGELLFPERYSRRYLEDELKPQLSAWGGDYAVSAQLQQRPVPRGGGIFKKPWFKITDDPVPADARRVRGWDIAGSEGEDSPWSVGVLMARKGKQLWVVDVERFRAEHFEVLARQRQIAERDGRGVEIDVPQDPGSAGKGVRKEMVGNLMGWTVHHSQESGSKRQRALPFASQLGAGNVLLCRGAWNDQYVAELCMFDRGPFKDQVDASSRACARLSSAAPSVSAVAAELY